MNDYNHLHLHLMFPCNRYEQSYPLQRYVFLSILKFISHKKQKQESTNLSVHGEKLLQSLLILETPSLRVKQYQFINICTFVFFKQHIF